MAEPAAAPQAFTFTAGTTVLELKDLSTGFSGATPRERATHRFPKRDGARQEDMGRGPRTYTARLEFTGPDCAQDFSDFERAVDANPAGLLNHPIVGQWRAFCSGPQYDVDFSRGLDHIHVNVTFDEDTLDADLSEQTPDVATAAQNATGQQAETEKALAGSSADAATQTTRDPSALDKINAAVKQIESVSDPLDYVTGQITQALGVASRIYGALNRVQVLWDVLNETVTDFVARAADLFSGDASGAAGQAAALDAVLGNVLAQAEAAGEAAIAASQTPAGAAEAVAQLALLVDACLTVNDAVRAAIPPAIWIVVPGLTNVMLLAQRRIQDAGVDMDVLTYASAILGLNRIPNPAAIPGGTRLRVPSLV